MFDHTKTEKVEWLNPIVMSQLQRAVLHSQKKVLLDGKEFSIEYGHQFGKVTDSYECVLLQPTDGSYVPMGYVSLSKILAFEFEDKETK